MRVKARVDLTYRGKDYPAGFIFDVEYWDGLDLINRDQAIPFNLEDPRTFDIQVSDESTSGA